MAQPGDIIYRSGVPFVVLANGTLAPYTGQNIGEMGATDTGFQTGSSSYVGTGQMGAIGGVLGVTGPTTSAAGKAAIDRLQNQADREACNASGGFYTQGGACLSGQEAEDQVNKILNNPDAPDALKQKAEAWQERNASEPEDTAVSEPEDQIEDGINVSDLIKTHGQETVDAIFDTAGEAIDIIKKTAKDPQAAIDSFIGTFGKKTKTGTWKDWTDVGIWGGILGIPLPPGFMGKSVRDIEEGLKKIGKTIGEFIEDPAGTLGDLVTDATNAITGVFTKGADPAGIYDFVSGIFGGAVSGIIMGEIGDTLDSLLLGEDEEEEEETEEVLFEGFEPDRETIVDPAEVDLSGLEEEGDEDDVVPGFVIQDPVRETIVDPAQDDEVVGGFQYATPCDNPQYAEANPEECGVSTAISFTGDDDKDDTGITGDVETCDNPAALNTGEEGECKYPSGEDIVEDPDEITDPPYTCDDPNATTRPDGSCGPCKAGYVFDGAVERCVQEDTQITGTTTTPEVTPPPTTTPPPETTPTPETGGGNRGARGMMTPQADPFVFNIAGDPQLLAKLEFPVVDYLAQVLPKDVQQNVMTGLFEDYLA